MSSPIFRASVVPPFNPLRLASNYRDGFGDAHARLSELLDPIIQSGCFEPRIFHAPATADENQGVTAADPYLEYVLELPAGSFIEGFLHHSTGAVNPNTGTCPPVPSTFRMQLTDIEADYKFFEKPIPEAWFLNDAPTNNPQGPYATSPSGLLYEINPSPRLLTAPYPVAPSRSGALSRKFRVEFSNIINSTNSLIQMTFLVAVPLGWSAAANGGGSNGG